jgi:hypothetical protein
MLRNLFAALHSSANGLGISSNDYGNKINLLCMSHTHCSYEHFDQFITPLVIIVILDHLFKAASTMEDHKMALLKHICDAIYYTLALSCINSWMDPSTDIAKELFFVLSSLHY